jgi:hypothetical protein
MLIKVTIHLVEITIVNKYAPNVMHPTSLNQQYSLKTIDRHQHNDSGRLYYPTFPNR